MVHAHPAHQQPRLTRPPKALLLTRQQPLLLGRRQECLGDRLLAVMSSSRVLC